MSVLRLICLMSFISSVKVVLHSRTRSKYQANEMTERWSCEAPAFCSMFNILQCIKTVLPQSATIEKNCNSFNGISTEVANSYAHFLLKLQQQWLLITNLVNAWYMLRIINMVQHSCHCYLFHSVRSYHIYLNEDRLDSSLE